MVAPRPLHVHVVERRRAAWALGFAAVAGLLLARNLVDLAGSPPGLYADEASIGYNAWAVSHYAVDEHGARLPLYFQAFGEFKNPVYVYALAALLRVMPLSATAERLPAALFGIAAVLLLTLAAWRISRSLPVTLAALLLAGLTPWITLESRVGFEVIAMVAALSGVLWALAGAEQRARLRHFAAAGLFLAVAVYAYSTGRLEVVLYTAVFVAAYGLRARGDRRWLLTLVPVVAAYGVLGVWALLHPGALTARFSALSIAADGAPFTVVLGRFFSNYISYFGSDFLFVQGDDNVRHSTHAAGMLLWATLPLLLAGVSVLWQRRTQALPRFVAGCLLLGPVAASVTDNGGVPHGLRSAGMVPFWIVLAVYGLTGIASADWLRRRPALRLAGAGALAAGLLAQAGYYTADLYSGYPQRAEAAFDTGEEPAMLAGSAVAQGSTIYLSDRLDVPYIQAYFALTPAPPVPSVSPGEAPALARLRMRLLDPALISDAARSGDVLVLLRGDPVPTGAALVSRASDLVSVYRMG